MASFCFVVALLPVLGLVDHYFLRFSFVGDHFQYLACMAPIAWLSAACVILMRRLPARLGFLSYIIPGLLVATLLQQTMARVPVFYSDDALWHDTISKNPTAWLAYSNLGADLVNRDRPAEAIDYLLTSLNLNPRQELVMFNLGTCLRQTWKFSAVNTLFHMAIDEYPLDSMFHNNLELP